MTTDERDINLLLHDAMWGEKAQELREMISQHESMVYDALRICYLALRDKYRTLVTLCDTKRSYEVPPEYSGVINIDNRMRWSPTDTEMARVLVGCTVADDHKSCVLYSDLVARLNSIVSTARPHIYRSLKVILRNPPSERGGLVRGIRLR